MKRIARTFSISSIVLLICILGIFAAPLKASSNTEEIRIQLDNKIKLYQLKHAVADEIAVSLNQLLEDDIRLTVDRRTNSIVIYGSEEAQDKAESIIVSLDVDVSDSDDAFQNVVFDVRDLADKVDISKLAPLVVNGRLERLFAARDGSLIVSASENSIARTRVLLDALRNVHKDDLEVDAGSRIRVAWLVSGLKTGGEISDDLKKATAELAKMGITDLRLAAQSIVLAKPYETFEINSVADVEGPCQFRISGQLGPASGGVPSLEIGISAQSLSGDAGIPIQTEIVTQISCPIGHTVVLGAAPIGSRQSVFVIQILKAE